MRRSGDAPRGSGAWAVAAVALAAAATCGGAGARPYGLEDALQREDIGEVAVTAGGRWLVVEQRRPYADGARFDLGRFNALFRTDLKVVDLRDGGAPRRLLSANASTGYRAGPLSPDGARLAVFRLTSNRWELGIATLKTGAIRWTGLQPVIAEETRTLQWLSPDRLVAILSGPGTTSFELRAVRPQAALPQLWAATARGAAAVTAVGSGRYLDQRPRDPPKQVVTVSAATGEATVLAEGDFTDVEASHSARRLVLIEAAEDIPLVAGREVQGAYGIAVRRMRLRLLDLSTGDLRTPCPRCDVMASLLAWSAADVLLAYVRDDGAPWRDGRLVRLDPGVDDIVDATPGLHPAIAGRPERVAAGWWGSDVVVFARRPGAPRDDWWRLGAGGPVKLTGDLQAPTREPPVVTPAGLLLGADGAAWQVRRDGLARRLTGPGFARLPRRGEGIPDRTQFALRATDMLPGILHGPDGARAVAVEARGAVRPLAQIGPRDRLLAATSAGALVEAEAAGGARTLAWRRIGATDRVVAHLNGHLADTDRPAAIPVTHPGPNGEALRSWLFLPPDAATPPPLIVVPYPGATHAAPPDIWSAPPMAPTAMLLGHGYAVLVPSLPVWRAGQGPADGLAQRVLAIVEAARLEPRLAGRFDATRLGLWGHSFGGYATAAILTQTDRFGAAVATAAPTDLVSFHGQFSPFRRLNPQEGLSTPWTTGWTETLQGDMRAPPWSAPERYRSNSPVMQAGRITTPLLLAYGDLDGAHPGQAEELFSALYRQGKDAVLLTYWGEGHLFASPGNLRDLFARAFAFLDARLMPTPTGSSGTPRGRPAPASASGAPTTRSPPRR